MKTEDAFVLEADLPGVTAEDVHVKIDRNDLVLQGHRAWSTAAVPAGSTQWSIAPVSLCAEWAFQHQWMKKLFKFSSMTVCCDWSCRK